MSFKNKAGKILKCQQCGEEVKVGHDADAVSCWSCVSSSLNGHSIDKEDDSSSENNFSNILPDQSK